MGITESELDALKVRAKERSALSMGDANAMELLSAYVKERDKDGYALMLYGDCLRNIGRLSDACKILRKALKFTPNEWKYDIYLRIGMARSVRVPESGEKWFKRATESMPSNIGWVWILRADNLIKMERFDEAIACLRKAQSSKDVDRDELYINLAAAYMATQEYDLAKKAFKKALHYDPDSRVAISCLEGLAKINSDIAFKTQYE